MGQMLKQKQVEAQGSRSLPLFADLQYRYKKFAGDKLPGPAAIDRHHRLPLSARRYPVALFFCF